MCNFEIISGLTLEWRLEDNIEHLLKMKSLCNLYYFLKYIPCAFSKHVLWQKNKILRSITLHAHSEKVLFESTQI